MVNTQGPFRSSVVFNRRLAFVPGGNNDIGLDF